MNCNWFGTRPAKLINISLLLFCACGACAQTANKLDTDRDGLPDATEQVLLERFRPTFRIDRADCAAKPSRFRPDTEWPEALSADGTIYGQAFPVAANSVEIHYYTLWSQNCGRDRSSFDVEHVSALISIEGPQPKAVYWYAGAHEQTVCNKSSGARAESVDAVNNGPTVWSAAGNHALYLSKFMCHGACGTDSCDNDTELARNGEVINIGELAAPANGSFWVASPTWLLRDRMASDFSAQTVARIDAVPSGTIAALGDKVNVALVDDGNPFVDGVTIGAQHTSSAIGTAAEATGKGVGKAGRVTGRSLKHAWDVVFR